MIKIPYSAPSNMLGLDKQGIPTLFYTDKSIQVKNHSVVSVEIPIIINLPSGVEIDFHIHPEQGYLMLTQGVQPYLGGKCLEILIYNPSEFDWNINPGDPLVRLDVYRTSITLAGVDYSKNTQICNIVYDNLEASLVKIPSAQLCFVNTTKEGDIDG